MRLRMASVMEGSPAVPEKVTVTPDTATSPATLRKFIVRSSVSVPARITSGTTLVWVITRTPSWDEMM